MSQQKTFVCLISNYVSELKEGPHFSWGFLWEIISDLVWSNVNEFTLPVGMKLKAFIVFPSSVQVSIQIISVKLKN